jgi:hypothetical protein
VEATLRFIAVVRAGRQGARVDCIDAWTNDAGRGASLAGTVEVSSRASLTARSVSWRTTAVFTA